MHSRIKIAIGRLFPVFLVYNIIFLACSTGLGASKISTEEDGSCSTAAASSVLLNLTSKPYDPRIRPHYGGEPVTVNVSYSVLGFRDIQEVDMTFVTDMYFRQEWKDNRLQHSLNCTLTFITGAKKPVDFIWVPDATFENSVTSYVHDVLVGNNRIDIYPDGKVLWGVRATAKAFCAMELSSYPFDVQVCPLTLVSYNYPSNHVRYSWKGSSAVTVFDNEMSQFLITNVKSDSAEAVYPIGKYSILHTYFTFERRLGYFVMQVYTPCVFLVMLAGFSFWVDPRATPARVALSLTTLLTTATIWSSVNSRMPKVSYVKAIDIFFLVSFGFVFATLMQYILLLTLKHQTHLKKLQKVSPENVEKGKVNKGVNSSSTTVKVDLQAKQRMQRYNSVFLVPTELSKSKESVKTKKEDTLDPETLYYYKQKKEFKRILWLDKISRVLYVLSYFLFLVLYWKTYSLRG